ncbi:Complex I intermediate-associated protein 30 (CIA30) [Musa troglodytarum]|uniref:Complex I intermediate-associated protein 30 (CIA30) n=1 Tax=Musa troglodytarum TaxID=320322 RepID=A0A9E7II82_9LILI|nr:Complex I intermediate-associated protein 30 (CIA30) [Musa troglodytarum]
MECCCGLSLRSSASALLDPQGISSSHTCKRNSGDLHHQVLSLRAKQFIPHTYRLDPCLYKEALPPLKYSRKYRGAIFAESGRQIWDFGRFIRTLYFFNGPPNPAKFFESLIEKLSSPASTEPIKKMETSDMVLVAGATGGVGRRVVNILRNKGFPVRALVRNKEKARSMLGPDVDLIVGDITKMETISPEHFKGVKKVINAASVIIGPKEGDTPDRAKYSQIKGDSPEKVEYIGMQNLINAVKNNVGLQDGELLFGFKGNITGKLIWGALDDVVMGGVSESGFQVDPKGNEDGGPTGLFKGVVSIANNGGFTSIRTKNFSTPEDLSAYDGIEIRVKGDGRRYKLILRTSSDWDTVGYTASFDTTKEKWETIKLPFSSFRPIFRARTLMYSKFEYDGKLNPTFVEGVTRPGRPGLDLSKQPPAVRLNKELGFVLTYKLKGEDLLRESGIPCAIVRPCALTEEPAGADLIFDQGDNITGKISREEIARICIAALDSPYACGKTFEVKSTVPFSEPYVIDPENPPPEKDYDEYFKNLKEGITGKEALEGNPVPV